MLEQEILQYQQNLLHESVLKMEAFLLRYNKNTKNISDMILANALKQIRQVIDKALADFIEALQNAIKEEIEKNLNANNRHETMPKTESTAFKYEPNYNLEDFT